MELLFIYLGLMWVLFATITFFVYNGYVSRRLVMYILDNNLVDEITRLNMLNAGIMSKGDMCFVKGGPPFFLFSKWHIQDIGVVPLWSPLSKELDRRHLELLTKS